MYGSLAIKRPLRGLGTRCGGSNGHFEGCSNAHFEKFWEQNGMHRAYMLIGSYITGILDSTKTIATHFGYRSIKSCKWHIHVSPTRTISIFPPGYFHTTPGLVFLKILKSKVLILPVSQIISQ